MNPTETGTLTPTQILMAEHRVIEMVLACLERIADRCASGEGLDMPEARDALDFIRNFADRCHHGKEEANLFPMLERHGLPANVGPTAVMRSEHDMGRAEVREMTAALDATEAGDDAAPKKFVLHARGFVRLLRDHIMKEDNVLFPMADNMIPPPAQQELLAAFAAVEHDDIGEGVHQKYLELATRLCEHYAIERQDLPTTGTGGGCCGGAC